GPIPGEDTTLESSSKNSTLAHASIDQPLSQLYKIGLGVRVKELARQIAAEQSRSQRQSVLGDVKSVYFGILQTQSGIEAAEESLAFYRELQDQVERDVAQQTALAADLLDVKSRRAKEEYDALVLRHSLATQKERMNALL